MFGVIDHDYDDYIENTRLNQQLDEQRKRADEATEILTALVQLKLMKSMEPDFYEGTKEAVWKLAIKFLSKDPTLKEDFKMYKVYKEADPEIREKYRRGYERFFGKDD